MSLTSIAVRPGGRTLAAYHQERAALYGAILALLGEEVDSLEIQDLSRRISRVRGTHHRARPVLEGVLEDSTLLEQREEWLRSSPLRSSQDLEALSGLAHQAAQCARALWDGDMAAAADLWDAQSHTMLGRAGCDLRAYADELMACEAPAFASLGRALRLMLADDAALAGIDARAPNR